MTQNQINLKSSQLELAPYDAKGWGASALLGFFIGLAIIVPGVSGATIAIIFGLYSKMVYAFSRLTREFKKCFLFLLPIGIGAVVGFLVGFFAVQKLIEIIPFVIVCLFAGLMIGAFPAVTGELKGAKLTGAHLGLMALGVLIPVVLSVGSIMLAGGSGEAALNVTLALVLLYIPLGAVLSVTQILPGLSATAILMAVGQFRPILSSLHLNNIVANPLIILAVAALGVGFIFGLLAFSKVLNHLLTTRKNATYFTIVGLSAGSIISMFINPDIFDVYKSWGGASTIVQNIAIGVVLLAAGALCAYLLVRYEQNRKKIKEQTITAIEDVDKN